MPSPSIPVVPLLAWLVLCLGPSATEGQVPQDPRIIAADSTLFAGEPEVALGLLESLADAGSDVDTSTQYEALWRAARASTTLGVLAEGGGPWQDWYGKAQAYAARAEAVDPARLEAPYWDIAAKGRVALKAGPVEASGLAESVRAGSHRILERDPLHAGAHNALGRLYLQVLTLPWAYRQLARVLSGRAAVSEASWESAESHLRRAVELDPGMLLYRVDFGRLLTDLERWGEAKTVLDAAIAFPPANPADPVFRREAERLRERIP